MTPPEDIPQPSIPRPRRPMWKSVVFGVTLLLCGAVIGGGLSFQYTVRRFQEEMRQPFFISPKFYRKISEELNLTPDQQDQIRAIFRRSQENMSDIRRDVRTQVDREFSLMNREVQAVLTPEQQEIWNERLERIGERLRQHKDRDRDKDWRNDRRSPDRNYREGDRPPPGPPPPPEPGDSPPPPR